MTNENVDFIDGQARELPERRLYRSTTNRSVAGVCAGLGEYFGIDVGVLRVLWLLSVLFSGGVGLLIYLMLAVVIPEEPADYAANKMVTTGDLWRRIKGNSALLWGVVIMIAGIVLLLNNFGLLPVELGWLWNAFWALFWPLLLIGVGLALLFGLNGKGFDWRQIRQAGNSLPLRRSRRDRVLAGVCGGLGEYLKLDPLLIRLLWALVSVFTLGTIGVLLYLAAAVLIPLESPSDV